MQHKLLYIDTILKDKKSCMMTKGSGNSPLFIELFFFPYNQFVEIYGSINHCTYGYDKV